MTPRIERRPISAGATPWPDSMHPVLRRVYAARGITSPSELEHRLAGLHAPQLLGGIDRACDLLETAIRDEARIIVVGDFDCDGATGTVVAVRGLRLLGARDVGYAVPNRMRHGYGLSPAIVEEIVPRKPRLLITVDNGVAAHAGVAAARAHGMRVIVTDHHLPGASLPEADAIVNPNLDRDPFPSKALAGVGVMFYVLLALRARLRERGWFAERRVAEPDLSALLDLVALGTVADLVPLDRNNRILVEAGLMRIRAGRACAGIAALFAAGKRDGARAIASDLGFAVGPRINAAGRLEDMTLGIECLLTDDAGRAGDLAETLSAINAERRDLQDGMVAQARDEVDRWMASRERASVPHGVVLFDPGWHHGVVGLVASKLKESLHRPVVACAPVDVLGDEVKASGRSIPGFHLRDALAEIDAIHPGLISRFGGHAMAAGLSLARANLEAFSAAFDAVARRHLPPDMLDAAILTDGELGAADFSLHLARELRDGGPWGQGFPEPEFEGEFAVESWKVVGDKHLKFKLRHAVQGDPLDAIAFNAFDGVPPPARLRAVFKLDVNEWNGRQSLQLLIRHMQACG
ncbi:MAG: single-stranded-DNA-specific exonuclease RecJ [Proteobacteria bacterium]|nr:single-stranded-DNA-specific exonuclease RecJ [Pseudomonadota bacterium]